MWYITIDDIIKAIIPTVHNTKSNMYTHTPARAHTHTHTHKERNWTFFSTFGHCKGSTF